SHAPRIESVLLPVFPPRQRAAAQCARRPGFARLRDAVDRERSHYGTPRSAIPHLRQAAAATYVGAALSTGARTRPLRLSTGGCEHRRLFGHADAARRQ